MPLFILALYSVTCMETCPGRSGLEKCSVEEKSNEMLLSQVRNCYSQVKIVYTITSQNYGSCKENDTPWHFTVRTLSKSDHFRTRKHQNDNISSASILMFSRSKTLGLGLGLGCRSLYMIQNYSSPSWDEIIMVSNKNYLAIGNVTTDMTPKF